MKFLAFLKETTSRVGDVSVQLSPASRRHGDKLVHVKTKHFDHAFSQQKDFYVGAGGKGGIGDRYSRVSHFMSHNPIHASEVYVAHDGRVGFSDGRHRYAVLRDRGHETIPVAMGKESIAHARKHGYIA